MLSKFSVKKPFTVFVAVVIILILGFVSYSKMTTELVPEMNLPYVMIMTTYPGASPDEVENSLTIPYEQALASISNFDDMISMSMENVSIINIAFTQNANVDTAVMDIQSSLDMIESTLPDGVGSPMILKLDLNMMPVLVSAVSIDDMSVSEASQYIDDTLLSEIKSVNGVASVGATGLIKDMVDITLSDEKIAQLNNKIMSQIQTLQDNMPDKMNIDSSNITSADLSNMQITKEMLSGILKGQNMSLPAGYVSSADGASYLVRIGDEIESVDDLNNLVITEIPMIGKIKISDVATVTQYDNSEAMYAKVNGANGFILQIQKQADASTSEVCHAVQDKFEQISKENDNIKFTTFMDQGVYIDIVVDTIVKNLIYGAILAIIILFFFLRKIKPTFIVGLSIIIGIITAFVLMYFNGVTLNIISMGGLALGVGMLVDNSIVVIENIYRLKSEGKSSFEAAVEGAKEVAGAITASTITTVIVFVPIVFTSGITRQLFTDMALTITYSLLASLVVALTVVPACASSLLKNEKEHKRNIIDKIGDRYAKFLAAALNKKILCVSFVIVLFVVSIFASFNLGLEFMPSTDTGEIQLSIEMPETYNKQDTYKALDEINSEISKIEDVDIVGLMTTDTSSGDIMSMMGNGITGYVLLKDERDISSNEAVDMIRDMMSDKEYKVVPSSSSIDMSSLSGSAISINIFSDDLDNLVKTANDVADIVSSVEGTTEVKNGIKKETKEFRIVVNKDKAAANGLTVAQVWMAVADKLKAPDSVTTIKSNNKKYEIYVKDSSNAEMLDDDIMNIEIQSPLGTTVKISDVAEKTNGVGMDTITRYNQSKYLAVSASLKDGYDIEEVNNKIEDLLEDYDMPEGTSYSIVGTIETINDAFSDLFLMMALAIVFIYLVMVAQFQSFKSPFIIMFTIPLAFTGGFIALFLTGTKNSVISMIGLVILIGIVVNNGIVFVDCANQQREKGMSVKDSLVFAGRTRLRPICMTALTTIFGLLITAFDSSSGGKMLQPIAITTIGGLLYATLLTLVFVPCMYAIFNRDKKRKD